ncbi:hypothetical protein P9598_gp52 [Escherichia phage vB_EcoD_Teewinot]|uniref:Uncharacterized protein n=1 Tax=Escherichia phage vB_EcoD_Teewinot TaxID=2894796 RepID=A0AAE8YV67_9CAUD|nr:hypothetical protein P9598_gp52 [Escherichia phage vB_EcoD_Teewinot]UGO51172.1 hypothetical protein TEEEWINOT_52 [Escherichia phage vB_EcoD_Teewinot]
MTPMQRALMAGFSQKFISVGDYKTVEETEQ